MKSSKIFLGTTLLLISANVLAMTDHITNCPDISIIQAHAVFTKAEDCSLYGKNVWCLMTNNFNFKSRDWNIRMMATLKASSPSEAVKLGNQFFKSKVTLNEPEEYSDGNCDYGSDKISYDIAAFSPPAFLNKTLSN